MDYCKYYTPPKVANFLVRQLKISAPEVVVDICCGSCNLLHAAGKRWPESKLLGVDINVHSASDVCIIQSDGRKYAIDHIGSFPLVLANPPFDFIDTRGNFPELYSGFETKYIASRLEIEMLLANLLLLNNNGTLLIIMPSTFVDAETNIGIRRHIASKYHIQKIFFLPEDTFGSAKISSYALVIRKNVVRKLPTTFCNISYVNGRHHIDKRILIPKCKIDEGNWNGFNFQNDLTVELKIRRGTISSQLFAPHGIPILHTAKMQNPWRPSIRYISEMPHTSVVYAENGDIIVSRIGKSAGQWYKHIGDKILISDCLYRIKDPTGNIANTLKGNAFTYRLKGVATRYITMADFENWYKSLMHR